MFDVSWSELLILAIVALVVVGPKELPQLLAMIGRYTGVVRRHANEFRKVFDDAMREAELDQVKRELEGMRDGVKAAIHEPPAKSAPVAAQSASVTGSTAIEASPAAGLAPEFGLSPVAGQDVMTPLAPIEAPNPVQTEGPADATAVPASPEPPSSGVAN